jgi:peptidoglycan/xylan/chitin deacetylase (PgdA/CDA1 family)
VGRHLQRHRDSVVALNEWGHLVGNHTYSHAGLVALAEAGGDLVAEVERTDALLRPIVRGPVSYFRAPYGNWRETVEPTAGVRRDRSHSFVAAQLNASGRLAHVVGPVNWDIVAEDWECWHLGIPPEEAARRSVEEADRFRRGLILRHDSSEDDALRLRNQTMLMTKKMVPELKRRGYRFVRLDEIPQVRSAAMVRSQVMLGAEGGPPLTLEPGGGDAIIADRSENAPRIPFGVAPLTAGWFALRARTGLFLSVPGAGTGLVRATSPEARPRESFRLEALGAAGSAVRSATGGYVTLTDTERGSCLALTPRRRGWTAFLVNPCRDPGSEPKTTPQERTGTVCR